MGSTRGKYQLLEINIMPDQEYLDLLTKKWQDNVEYTEKMTPDTIATNAVAYIKRKVNIRTIINAFIVDRAEKREAIFMSGLSGAGKSEFVHALDENNELNIISPDEIRKFLPGYTGKNAHLFQEASATGASKLIDTVFSNHWPFILDTNLANRNIAFSNIERAIKKGYTLSLYFVHRHVDAALAMAEHREMTEGRHVPYDVFVKKGIGAINTFTELMEKYIDHDNIGFYLISNKGSQHLSGVNSIETFKKTMHENLTILTNSLDLDPSIKTIANKAPCGSKIEDAVKKISKKDTTQKFE